VHIPFCEAKCAYCHFAIDPRRPDAPRQERYLRALLQEMEPAGLSVSDTLYFGGGTPSLMSPERIAQLVAAARERFGLDPNAEVTLEANPRDLDASDFAALRGAGVNRLSLGAQAFDADVLTEMGRLHTAEDAAAALQHARRAGFRSVSIDLILGWPGETAERWRRNLAAVAALRPDHMSLYVLEVEGKTLLAHRARQGRLALPDDDLVADLYRESVKALAAIDLARYEISNFAKPGHESRHNAKYWEDAPFLGFGMAAHSYRAGRRHWNLETYAGYCRAVELSGNAVAGVRALTAGERRSEALFTGLRRMAGVKLAAFRQRHGVDPLLEFEAALRRPLAAGLVEVADGSLRLTEAGVLLSNEVFEAFV
jgi:oxygen-independent coproporphyrinogen-3 oxidase